MHFLQSQYYRIKILILTLLILFCATATPERKWGEAAAAQCQPIIFTPASLPTGTIGLTYNQTITLSGGTAPYTLTLSAGSLPPGLTFSNAGVFSGKLATPGRYEFTLKATDAKGCSGAKIYTLIIECPAITLNPGSPLPTGSINIPYSQAITATSGAGPYTYSLDSGSLPPGLTLSVVGLLSGTPTTSGNYNFRVRASGATGCFGVRNYTLTIDTCPAINLDPVTVPVGQVGLSYSRTISATGGTAPYVFSIATGALPPGLSLASNGNLSGTPTTAGNYSFSVRASDAFGCAGVRNYQLVVNNPTCPAIALSPQFLPVPRIGNSYNQTISATGGTAPYTFSIASGTLTAGLSLSSTGNLTGTPTTISSYTFTVRATDMNGCTGERTYTQNVLPCEGITIAPTGTGVPSGRVDIPYNLTFTATGGTAPYSFRLGNLSFLPPGLTLSSNGLLSGTPTTAGNYTFLLVATDANGCLGQALTFLNINDPDCPDINLSPSSLPLGTTGAVYNQTFTASGGTGPYTFTIGTGALPDGVTLSTNGNLTGTPTTAGSYGFTVRATDANGCAGVEDYQLSINNPACPVITINPTNATIPAGATGAAYNQTFSATGGADAYLFSIVLGVLPPGLSLASNGGLTGVPTSAGSYSFTVRATDANGCIGERTYSLTIGACPTITLNPASPLPSGRIATPYSQTITPSGGTAPYLFSLATGSSLPAGLTLSPDGLLSGTPATGGNFSFTIVATDTGGCIGSRLYNLFIDPCALITINPTDQNLPPATISTPYSQTFSVTGGVAPYTLSLIGGVPPLGLTFNPATGILSGAPTQTGTFNFSVRATDANGCTGARAYMLLVNSTCPAITVNPTDPNLSPGTVGTPYTQTFSATGGAAPYSVVSFSGTPPTGLSLDFMNGVLSGTPVAPGTFTFTVGFKDAGQCPGERTYTLVINNPDCPNITINPNNSPLPTGKLGTLYSQTFTGTGGTAPYTFSITFGALPGGLTLSSGGNLTGTPAIAGTFNFNLRMTDASGCMDEANYDLVIAVNPVISVSAASFATNSALATESIIAAFGLNMATGTQIASTLPLPTELAGASLKVKDNAGAERLAPLFFVSPTQINYQIPPGTMAGAAGLTVLNGTSEMAAGGMEVANVSPGLFSADASGQGIAAAVALRVRADGTLSYEPIARYDAAQSRFVAEPIDLGPDSDQIFVLFYGTGWKFRSALSAVSCSIGGLTNEVLYAGEAPGFVGLDQVNARLSRSLAGRGEVDVVLTVDGKIANTVRIAIR